LRGQFSGVDGMAVDGFVTDRSSHNGSHYTRWLLARELAPTSDDPFSLTIIHADVVRAARRSKPVYLGRRGCRCIRRRCCATLKAGRCRSREPFGWR
jgi:hypothetical protein